MRCPRSPWHGAGPFPRGACYWCWKLAVLAGEPVPDEARTYAGFGTPTRLREPGWHPAELVALVADRERRDELGDGGRALLRALARIGERKPR
jgi:hypothetical protein